MADTLGADVKTLVDAVSLPETDYEVWLKAAFNAVEEWVGVQDSIAAVSSNTVLVVGSARTTKMTTGAGDKTVTLPAGSTVRDGQRFRVTKADGDAGKCTLLANVGEADTIDGVAAGTGVDIDSQYDYVEVEWMAGYWTISPGGYKDHGDGFCRKADGTMEAWSVSEETGTTDTLDANNFGTTAGNIYYEDISVSFPTTFNAAPNVTPGVFAGNQLAAYNTITTSGFALRAYDELTASQVKAHWRAIGRWRT